MKKLPPNLFGFGGRPSSETGNLFKMCIRDRVNPILRYSYDEQLIVRSAYQDVYKRQLQSNAPGKALR